MNLWNTKNLPVPPINTYKTTNKNIDIKYLFTVFNEGKNFFEDDNYLYAEYAVLSRIVYRMKQKFRSAKDFKAVEKIYKALDNYFKMDIASNLHNFMDLIPSRYKDETYLPTKNLLDYILVRLQGLAKLTERIVETCKISAYLLDKRIHTGHFWKIAFIIFSLVSRIYVLAKYIAKFICAFYNKLLPFSSQLRNTNCNLLPEKYILPNDLKEWMNVEWLEVDDEVQIIDVHKELPDITQFFDLVDDDDVEFCNEYIMVDDDEDTEVVKDFMSIGRNLNDKYLEYLGELRGFNTREDVGEVIEVNDSLLTTKDVGGVIEVNDSLLNEEEIGEVIEVNDSLLMPSEENSVQILDYTMTDNVVNDSLQMLEDNSLQILDSTIDNKSENKKSDHTLESSSFKSSSLNINNNTNVDVDDTRILRKQTEETENSVIEIKDGNDNERNVGENKTNINNSVAIIDTSVENKSLREDESVITVSDISVIQALDIVPKKKTKKGKKVIKNADIMKNELAERNQESVVNITKINEDNSIVSSGTPGEVKKVKKRKKKTKNDVIDKKLAKFGKQGKKGDLSSKKLLKGIRKEVKAIKQLVNSIKCDLLNKEIKEDHKPNKRSNSNTNLHSFKNKGTKKKKKFDNKNQTNSSSVSPTSANKSSKRTRDNLEKKLIYTTNTKTNTKNAKKQFNKHKLENTERIIERGQRVPKKEKSKQQPEEVTNGYTKIHLKEAHGNESNVTKQLNREPSEKLVKGHKNTDILTQQHFKPNSSLVIPKKGKTFNSSSPEASISSTSANNSRKRRLDDSEKSLDHIKKFKTNIKDTKKQFRTHKLKKAQKIIERKQVDNTLVIPNKEKNEPLPKAVTKEDTKIHLKTEFSIMHGNKSNTTKQLKEESREKSVVSHKNIDVSHKSISNTNRLTDAAESKNMKRKMLQKIKTKEGDIKSSLKLRDNLYKQNVAKPKRDKGQMKNKRKRKKKKKEEQNIHN